MAVIINLYIQSNNIFTPNQGSIYELIKLVTKLHNSNTNKNNTIHII